MAYQRASGSLESCIYLQFITDHYQNLFYYQALLVMTLINWSLGLNGFNPNITEKL